MNIGTISTFAASALAAAMLVAGCSPRTTDHVKERGATDPVAELAGNMVSIPGKNYAICKFEVTQALWFAVMGKKPSRFKGADLPVENVALRA